MEFLANHLLTFILFLPAVGALVLLGLPAGREKLLRWVALTFSLLVFALSLAAWARFDPTMAGFQMVEKVPWFAAIQADYHLGIDGLSLAMVLLTALLTPLALLASGSIRERLKGYLILFLLLETGMLGVFLSLDLLLFFVFWEVGLVPMYFLINQWGGANRNYASLKFILYTMGGSLGLLLATQAIGVVANTYDLTRLYEILPSLQDGTLFNLPVATVKSIAFWAFVIAFAVKVPVFPFHTWLPDAHTEAPTAGSMILAGVLLKLGAYGFLRLVLPLFPQESQIYAGWLAAFGALAIIMGAFGAYGQSDFKRLVAYSSINHMGFVVLGIAAAAKSMEGPHAVFALNGAVLQMVTHGLSAAGMFFLVGVLYDQAHTRNLNDFGGLWRQMPVYGSLLLATAMASLGLPAMGGFVSEFLVVRGAFPVFTLVTTLSMIGLLFTGAYILKALKMVLHGPLNERWQGTLRDVTALDVVIIAPMLALTIAIGVYPAWLMDLINRAINLIF